MSKFWDFIKNQATDTQPESVELRIEGDIVDDGDVWVYEWFGETATAPNTFKEELSQFKGKDLTVWIDSYGGSVFAGASIYNALKEHDGKITVKVDGKAMSAASVIAMAGDEILMSPVAVMMIHNPLIAAYGNMHDLRKTADILDQVKESIVNAYVTKTGRSRNKISQMMDEETWMSANVAVKEGFADGVLYQDSADEALDGVQNFSFNRLAVVNSANQSIKHALDLFKDKKIKNEANNVVEYTLELTRGSWEIKPGIVVEDAILYNGAVPGPEIRAKEGDTVRVTLQNNLEESTTIHWHGLKIPNNMDGVPPFSQTEVAPGDEFVYEFTALKAGTYMYHPHGGMHLEQIDKGAYGFVIIDPPDGGQYNKEYNLMLSTWYHEDSAGMVDMEYNTYTINGKAYPDIVLDVQEGDRVLMRFGNLSAALAHPIHIHGHDFNLVAKDGSPLPMPWIVNTINVAPGETYDLEFVADNPGIWVGHCHNLHHLPDMQFLIRYEGFELPEIEESDMGDMEMKKDKKKKKKMPGMPGMEAEDKTEKEKILMELDLI